MDKFDGVRMKDLVKVEDPNSDGGLTLVFTDNTIMKIKIVDGKLSAEVNC